MMLNKKKEFLEKVSSLYDKSVELINSEDGEKILGRVMLLSNAADKDNDADAAIELMILGYIKMEKDNE